MSGNFNQLDDVNPAVIQDFTVLLSELSRSFNGKDADEKYAVVEKNLTAALNSRDAFVLVYADPESKRIVSTATGNVIGNSGEGWVDDVVTLPSHRGQRLARTAMEGLHEGFKQRGILTSRLTSKKEREAAGTLYDKMGYNEGGEVWRATTEAMTEKMVHANTTPNFTPVNCLIPTGNKAWSYGPNTLGSVEDMAEDLRATSFALRASGVELVNHFLLEPDEHVTAALQTVGYARRDETRLYTLDLNTVR